MTMDSKTTRRSVLAGIAAAPVASIPALAAPQQHDPIYAAIAEHETAYRKLLDWEHRRAELEDMLPPSASRTFLNVYLEPQEIVETDDPRWRALAAEWIVTFRSEHRAVWSLVDTKPATREGAIALLQYVARQRFGDGAAYFGFPERRIGWNPEDDADHDLWSKFLIESVARQLTVSV